LSYDNKKTILLVEDETLIALQEQALLQEYGYTVMIVNSGEKAVAIMREQNTIDIILMDIDLGKGMDGTEAAGLILKDKDIPIVFLSSHIESAIVKKTETISSYGYIIKNSNITILDASIKMAFRLFESESKYHAIIMQSRDGIVITNESGDIITWNKSLEIITGLQETDVIGQPLWQVQWELTPEKLRTQQRLEAMKRFLHDSLELNIDFQKRIAGTIFTINGLLIDVETSNFIVTTESGRLFGAIFRDVTEQKVIENRLKLSEEKYRNYIENATEAVFATDKTGHYIEVNTAASTITGYSRDELLHMSISDFLVDEPNENELNCIRDFLITGSTKSEKRFKHKDGSSRWWAVEAIRINENESLALAHDITDRKKQEQELQDNLAEKELILREVHHRIKNNMNTMKSLVFLQRNMLTDNKAIEALSDVENRFTSMSVLYDKLYQTSSFSDLSMNSYFPSLIVEVIDTFPNCKNISTVIDIDDCVLNAKLLQTLGIIVNEVITNIMKYAFGNAEQGEITVIAKQNGNHILFSIHDNGRGIPNNIGFSNSPGFGLVLISQLIQQIDGSIKIERKNGTTILFEFDK
jgi:PAS domain S-box-containing protein